MAATRGVTFVGANFGGSGANLQSGSWSLSGISWVPGDFALFIWTSRDSGRTFTEPGTVTQKIDTASAGFGHMFIGYRTLVAGDTTFAWTATSSTNNTDGFYTVVFRNVNGSAADPFERTSAATPGTFTNTQSPDPPALSAATILDKDVVFTVFSKNNDYGASITVPSTYSGDTAARYEETSGTDGSSGFAWLLDVAASTTSNPGAWTLGGAATDDGLQWTAALRSNVRDTLAADAVIFKSQSASFTANAIIKKTQSASFTADAYIVPAVKTFTADAIIRKTQIPVSTRQFRFYRATTYTTDTPTTSHVVNLPAAHERARLIAFITFIHATGTVTQVQDNEATNWVVSTSARNGTNNVFIGTFLNANTAVDPIGINQVTFTTSDSVAATIVVVEATGDEIPTNSGGAGAVQITSQTTWTSTAAGTDFWLYIAATAFLPSSTIGISAGGTLNQAAVGSATAGFLATAENPSLRDHPQLDWTASPAITGVNTKNTAYSSTTGEGFTANAWIAGRFTADAVISAGGGTVSTSFTANAIIKREIAPTLSADAIIKREQTASFSSDAIIARQVMLDPFTRTVAEAIGLGTSPEGFEYRRRLATAAGGTSVDGSNVVKTSSGGDDFYGSPLVRYGLVQVDFFTGADPSFSGPLNIPGYTIPVGSNFYDNYLNISGDTSTTMDVFLDNTGVIGFTVETDTWYTIKGLFTDQLSLQTRIKVWKRSDPEPLNWNASADHQESNTQVEFNSLVNYPISQWDNLYIRTFDAGWGVSGSFTADAIISRPVEFSAAPLEFISRAAAAADTVSLPSFVAGDIAIVTAFRDGSNTAPSLPSGWTNINSSGANTCSQRVGFRVLQGGDTTIGTWTNATEVQVLVFRNQRLPGPGFPDAIGASANTGASSNQINYPALSLQDASGRGWVLGAAGHRTATDVVSQPVTGMTTRSSGTPNTIGAHTDEFVTSFASTNYDNVVNASSGWRSTSVEILSTAGLTANAFIQPFFTANAVIKREQTASFTANAVIAKTIWSDNFNRSVGSGINPSSDGNTYAIFSPIDLVTPFYTPGAVDGSAYTIVSGGGYAWTQWRTPLPYRGVLQFDFWTAADHAHFIQLGISSTDYLSIERSPISGYWRLTSGGGLSIVAEDDGGGDIPALVPDSWYTAKLVLDYTDLTSQRGKIWKVGDPEPDWQDETNATQSIDLQNFLYVDADSGGTTKIDNLRITTFAATFFTNTLLLADAVIMPRLTADAFIQMYFRADAVIAATGTVSTSFTADAVLLKTQTASITADAVVKREQTASLTANAVILRTQSASLTTDAVIRRERTASLTADAVIRREQTATFTSDAVIKREITATFTANAVIRREITASLTANAVIFRTQTASFTADAVLLKTQTATFSADAILRVARAASFTSDAVIKATISASLTTNAVIFRTITATLTADAILMPTFRADAVILRTQTASLTSDAVIMPVFRADAITRKIQEASFTADAFVQGAGAVAFSTDAVIFRTQTASFTSDAVLLKTQTASFSANAVVLRTQSASLTADAVLKREQIATFTADAVIKREITATFTANAVVLRTQTAALTADAVIYKSQAATYTANAITLVPRAASFAGDAVVLRTQAAALTANAVLFRTQTASLTADAVIMPVFRADAIVLRTQTAALTADAVVMPVFRADAILRVTQSASFTADAFIFGAGATAFTADAVIKREQTATITSDAVTMRVQSAPLTADAVLKREQTATFGADAVLRREQAAAITADAVLLRSQAASAAGNAVLLKTQSAALTADAFIQGAGAVTFSTNAVIQREQSASLTANAVLRIERAASFTADAMVRVPRSATFTSDAVIFKTQTRTLTGNAVLLTTSAAGLTADAYFVVVNTVTLTADAVIVGGGQKTLTLDAVFTSPFNAELDMDAWIALVHIGVISAAMSADTIEAALSGDFIEAELSADTIAAEMSVVFGVREFTSFSADAVVI